VAEKENVVDTGHLSHGILQNCQQALFGGTPRCVNLHTDWPAIILTIVHATLIKKGMKPSLIQPLSWYPEIPPGGGGPKHSASTMRQIIPHKCYMDEGHSSMCTVCTCKG
jgi:hypothetical protein